MDCCCSYYTCGFFRLESQVYGVPPPPQPITDNAWTLGKKTSDHGVNDLSFKIRQELDRSIAKHLEKGISIFVLLFLFLNV